MRFDDQKCGVYCDYCVKARSGCSGSKWSGFGALDAYVLCFQSLRRFPKLDVTWVAGVAMVYECVLQLLCEHPAVRHVNIGSH